VYQIYAFQSLVASIAAFALIGVKLWALVDAITRRADAFVATGKMTKQAWLLILGLSLVAAVISPGALGLLSIVGTVAAFVYLLDVRPALASVTRRR
jgi:hypothetical protein